MGKASHVFIWPLLACILFGTSAEPAGMPVRMAIFNFQTLNIEASGQGTAVTNILLNSLMAEHGLTVLDRKEMESFLTLNDLQQKDTLENVVDIGTRLGLNLIVVGNVEKKAPVLIINCRVISIDQKRAIFSRQIRSLADANINKELSDLSKAITLAALQLPGKVEEKAACAAPNSVQIRPGNRQIQLSWEPPPNTNASAYEVFRATSNEGPFARIAQVSTQEYYDQNLEKGIVYFFKIRGYNERGAACEFSGVVSGETVLTPNQPVILKAETHVKSIQITWTPSPISSSDPLRLTGYKLYRSGSEKGSYREVANLRGKDLGIGIDTATTLDKLFKVIVTDLDKLLKVTVTDKGLEDGNIYYYKVTAYNEKNIESDYSSPIKGITIPPISGLTVQGDLIREVRLSWNALEYPEVKGYNVYRSNAQNEGFVRVGRVNQPTGTGEKKLQFNDTDGLADSMQYYYRITSFETPELETSPSVIASARTRGKPPSIEGAVAKGGLLKKIEISWTPSNAEEVVGYKIYSARKSDGEFVLIKKVEGRTSSKYVDDERDHTKLEDNGTYYYRLTAYNKVDVDSQSVDVSASTKPLPSQPQGLKAEPLLVKQASLSWNANPEGDIASYHLWRSSTEGGDFSRVTKVAGSTSYVDKDLQDGATYRYRLQAEDRDGLLSDFSETIPVKTKPRPQSPVGLSGEVRSGMVNLKWNMGQEPDISLYRVYEKRLFGIEKIGDVKKATFSEKAPPKGKRKIYLITAIDKDGLESITGSEIIITVK